LHLICIKELSVLNKDSCFKIYCFVQDKNGILYKQMVRTIEMLALKNVCEISVPKHRLFQIFVRLIFGYFLFFKLRGLTQTFVILDFRNTFMHFLRRLFPGSRFILIDDGYATYEAFRDYIKFGYYLPYRQYKGVIGWVNRCVHFGSDFNRLLREEFDLFTIYARELGLDAKAYNGLFYTRKLHEIKKLNYSDKFVYFAGARLSEKGVCSMEEEVRLIVEVNNYWVANGKQMIYVGKRVQNGGQSEKKMKLIAEYSIPVVYFDLPLELALLEKQPEVTPKIICSFGSTSNSTLPMLHRNMSAYLVEIKDIKKAHIDVSKVVL